MRKLLVVPAVVVLALVIASSALAVGVKEQATTQGAAKARIIKFSCSGTIDSVDVANNTFVVKAKAMGSSWRGARKARGKSFTISVTDQTTILLRELRARGSMSRATPLAFADLKPGRQVNVTGNVVIQNGTAQLVASRVVMLVPTYNFQSNATIVSVDAATNTLVVKIKTMSRMWNGWKKMNLRGREITIVVTETTKIFTRQLGADGPEPAVPATFADLVPNNRVHIAGKVEAADDGSNLYRATRIVEFLPPPPG